MRAFADLSPAARVSCLELSQSSRGARWASQWAWMLRAAPARCCKVPSMGAGLKSPLASYRRSRRSRGKTRNGYRNPPAKNNLSLQPPASVAGRARAPSTSAKSNGWRPKKFSISVGWAGRTLRGREHDAACDFFRSAQPAIGICGRIFFSSTTLGTGDPERGRASWHVWQWSPVARAGIGAAISKALKSCRTAP